jgi:hypothetical protein
MTVVCRGTTQETLQCIIAVEVMFVPSAYDINPSPLLHYRRTVMNQPEGSGSSYTDNKRSPPLGKG